MSRIGRLPVAVPASVQNVTIEGDTVTVTGPPKGELKHVVPAPPSPSSAVRTARSW